MFLFILCAKCTNNLLSLPSDDNPPTPYTINAVRNQKYNMLTFLPIVLYEQFKFFFNLYFLLVALSQLIPALKIGRLFHRTLSAFAHLLIQLHISFYCRISIYLLWALGICPNCHNVEGGLG